MCPWRSGTERLALCRLATDPGTYKYKDLADTFGTTFPEPDHNARLTAKQVGKLFGIGKGRVLSVEKEALDKIKKAIVGDGNGNPGIKDGCKEFGDLLKDMGVE